MAMDVNTKLTLNIPTVPFVRIVPLLFYGYMMDVNTKITLNIYP